ncbi:MAG: hypothetical protein A2V78_15800 [Betaproteobacteria bacterium RBG_16_64_18]|nr:MAG: hypothetical protein A2V78_15800 [Betaproteobacteria bacterium RBG_16_64_18]
MSDSVKDEYVQGKAQWRVGISALCRVRNLVDGYEKDERFNRAAAKYVAAGFVLALVLALATLWFSPETIQNLLRSLS